MKQRESIINTIKREGVFKNLLMKVIWTLSFNSLFFCLTLNLDSQYVIIYFSNNNLFNSLIYSNITPES